MGKRKQRKIKEPHKEELQAASNQENQQVAANYLTPSKKDKLTAIPQKVQQNVIQNPYQQQQQTQLKDSSTSKIQEAPFNKQLPVKNQIEQSKVAAPGYLTQATQLRKTQFSNEQELNMTQNMLNEIAKTSNSEFIQSQLRNQQMLLDQQRLYQEQQKLRLTQNRLMFTLDKEQSNEEEYESEDNYVDYGHEEGIQFPFKEEHATTADDNYYDEIEPYENIMNIQQDQIIRKQQEANQYKNQRIPLGQQRPQLNMETYIQNDEQIQSDIKFCLYCIYNNHDLQKYFKQLLRVQRKLKESSFDITPNLLFTIFEENIKEFMHGIRDKLIEEMKTLQMIVRKPLQRRYSYDDYFLIDRVFQKSNSLHGYNNEIFNHYMRYMVDNRYEQVRNDIRHRIWGVVKMNNEVVAPFMSKPEAYRKIFDMIIKFYTRVRESLIGIEEIWVFLIESVFQQELKGNLIFEQFHKQIFKKDILGHRYIANFLKEIKEAQVELNKRKQQQNYKMTMIDQIIENLNDILIQLDEDLNFQYPEEEDDSADQITEQQQQQQIAQDTNTSEQILQEDEQMAEYEESYIITYQQLQDKMKEKYGGQSLAAQVNQFGTQQSSASILKTINQERRSRELMKMLPNLDTDTLCYIIDHNLTQKDYEQILIENQQKQKNQDEEGMEDIIISPSKNLHYQYFQNVVDEAYQDQNNSLSDGDEDDRNNDKVIEKKKKKNLKKKRKRKEKKVLAQHQEQLDDILRRGFIKEQQKRSGGVTTQQLKDYIFGSEIDIKFNDPFSNMQQDEEDDEEEEIEQDSQFEEELEKFKQRMDTIQNESKNQKSNKLVPNIPSGWINLLRVRLTTDYKSPRNNAANKMGVNLNGDPMLDFSNLPENLWVKFHQHSA